MFVSSPLSFIENQCYDLLTTIADLTVVPDTENHLQKVYHLKILVKVAFSNNLSAFSFRRTNCTISVKAYRRVYTSRCVKTTRLYIRRLMSVQGKCWFQVACWNDLSFLPKHITRVQFFFDPWRATYVFCFYQNSFLIVLILAFHWGDWYHVLMTSLYLLFQHVGQALRIW